MRHPLNFLLHRVFESLLMTLALLFPRFDMLFAGLLKVGLDLQIVLVRDRCRCASLRTCCLVRSVTTASRSALILVICLCWRL